MEAELGMLRERAHSLWEGQAAGKGFVHRVCQLAARYLALSNRTKVTSAWNAEVQGMMKCMEH